MPKSSPGAETLLLKNSEPGVTVVVTRLLNLHTLSSAQPPQDDGLSLITLVDTHIKLVGSSGLRKPVMGTGNSSQ